MAGKPPAPNKAADAALAAIVKRYGSTGWGPNPTQQQVYDVVSESNIPALYGKDAAHTASGLMAATAKAKGKKK